MAAICRECGGAVVPYQHPIAPETFPPFVCSNCGRFYMRSEVQGLETDGGPQEAAHKPVDVSWHEWEPGHEGKAIVTDGGHVYSWSNGRGYHNDAAHVKSPNGGYLPHTQFMREHLDLDPLGTDNAELRNWHYFEIDPDGTVLADSPEDRPDYPEAVEALAAHHPALNTRSVDKWKF